MGVGAQRPPPQPWGTPRPLYLCAVSPSGPQHPSLETPSLSRDCSTSPNHSLLICQMGAQAPRLGPWWGGWWLSSKALASAGVTTEPGSGTQDDDAHGACLGMLNRREPLAEREPDPWSPSDKRETVSHSPAPPRAALPPRKPRSPDRHLQERVGPAALGRRPGGWLLRIRTGETGSSHSWRLPKSPRWRPAFLHRAPHSRNPAEMPQELDR